MTIVRPIVSNLIQSAPCAEGPRVPTAFLEGKKTMKTKKTKKRRTLDPIKEIEFEIKTCEAEALDKHGPKSSVVAEWRSIIRELERMRKTYGDARLRRTFGKGIPESAFREFRRSAAERARAAHSIEATP